MDIRTLAKAFVTSLLFLTLVIISNSLSAFQKKSPSRLVLTNVYNGLEHKSQFSCSEKIHGYITLPATAMGRHTLEGVWVMPNGSEGEHSINHIEFSPPGRQTAYIWLELQDRSQGSLGDFRSAQKEGPHPHEGEWKVKVLWDGKEIVESKFNVKCL